MPDVATVRCSECGTSLEDALRPCPHCGAASPVARTAEVLGRATERKSAGVPVPDVELLPLLAELKEALEPQLILLKPLAKGGMGLVYLARDPALKRLVVVKVLAPALAQNDRARARFKREAEAAAAVAHPNVVSIYEVGELPKTGTSYIVMQFVEGPTLNEAFPGGTVAPESEARRILSEVASALAAAHVRRLVHRDIKPTNVILDRSTGRAVVLDFGISAILVPNTPTISGRFTSAPRLTGGFPAIDHTIQSGLTSEGMVIGTPYYMSPEQAAMEQVTPKSDVYSLGVLAFELVTGGLPFVEPTPAAMAAAHLNQAPPKVEGLRHDLDPEFAALIDRCLAKLPADRPSAEAIARALMPEAATKVEWPPPGLDRLTGRGWRALMTAVSAESLALLAMSLTQGLGAFESAQAAGVIASSGVVLFTLLMLRTGTTTADAMTGLLRGLRAGYPREILIDAALDRRRDAGDLVNGLGAFALVPESGRKQMLRSRRDGAGILLAGVGGTGILAGVWSLGAFPTGLTGVAIVAAPLLLAGAMRALLTLPERRVRIRASRDAGYRGFGRTPPIRAELVKGWLESAGQATPRTAAGRERLSLEVLALPWLLLLGPLVALIVMMLKK